LSVSIGLIVLNVIDVSKLEKIDFSKVKNDSQRTKEVIEDLKLIF